MDTHDKETTKISTEPKKSTIYTRKGDKGVTQLYNGQKIPKFHPVFHAMGKLDQLNSQLGVVYNILHQETVRLQLDDKVLVIQELIIEASSSLATPVPKEPHQLTKSKEKKVKKTRFSEVNTLMIEKWIDQIDHILPPLKDFIIPGGCKVSCQVHLARAQCREAERYLFQVSDETANPLAREYTFVEPTVYTFVNRLSDFLFALARYATFSRFKEENNRARAQKKLKLFRCAFNNK